MKELYQYVTITDIRMLTIGATVYFKYPDLPRYVEHTIRPRVTNYTKKGFETKESETEQEYESYKDWVRGRFRKGEFYTRERISEEDAEQGGSEDIGRAGSNRRIPRGRKAA